METLRPYETLATQRLMSEDDTLHSSFSFLVSCGGVRLSPLGASATIWAIVPAPDDR
jgi:hypothetical protein